MHVTHAGCCLKTWLLRAPGSNWQEHIPTYSSGPAGGGGREKASLVPAKAATTGHLLQLPTHLLHAPICQDDVDVPPGARPPCSKGGGAPQSTNNPQQFASQKDGDPSGRWFVLTCAALLGYLQPQDVVPQRAMRLPWAGGPVALGNPRIGWLHARLAGRKLL
jgi:hypothetical protein